jgi:hypothetical protein
MTAAGAIKSASKVGEIGEQRTCGAVSKNYLTDENENSKFVSHKLLTREKSNHRGNIAILN